MSRCVEFTSVIREILGHKCEIRCGIQVLNISVIKLDNNVRYKCTISEDLKCVLAVVHKHVIYYV